MKHMHGFTFVTTCGPNPKLAVYGSGAGAVVIVVSDGCPPLVIKNGVVTRLGDMPFDTKPLEVAMEKFLALPRNRQQSRASVPPGSFCIPEPQSHDA